MKGKTKLRRRKNEWIWILNLFYEFVPQDQRGWYTTTKVTSYKNAKPKKLLGFLLPFTNQRETDWFRFVSSHVAALRYSSQNQLIPQANHLSRGLVMRGQVILYATKLTKLDAVNVFNRFCSVVELFYPHSHTHIFHLEHLQYHQE